jgi:lactobin A/cerein 7B family class IIb bacteriocin
LKFEEISNSELSEINGGILPVLIGAGIVGSLVGGFGLGYGLSRVFG